MKPEEILDRFVKVPLDLLRGDSNLDENEKLVWIVLQSLSLIHISEPTRPY